MANRPTMSRRRFLASSGGAAVLASTRHRQAATLDRMLSTAAPCASSLADIHHVVILIQENRSFDSYFGTYKGVRGFDDRTVPRGAAAFGQSFTPSAKSAGLQDPVLPWHLSTAVSVPPQQGDCSNDIEHQWAGQHDTWNGGAVDNWMGSHLATEPDGRQAAVTMSYYTRADLPFYYALADNFTLCDNYFCSVIAGTDVNRLCSITGTIDPDGWDGGLQFLDTKLGTVNTPGADLGTGGRWTPYPAVLQKAGVSWKVYGTPDGQAGDNVLRYFPQFRPVTGSSSLSGPAFSSNAFPADFAADCAAGTLPQVSWLLAGVADTEHAPDPVTWGESVTWTVLEALSSSPAWANTALFVTYDENGGFFDHVPPPTPPAGTAGEYLNQAALTATARKEATTVAGKDLSGGPIGLGFRVPMLVVSPFSRNPSPSGGPLVCSDRLDHTSLLRFLETWTGAVGKPARIVDRDPATKTPGLSAWRRSIVGDLTTAFNFAAAADATKPAALSIVPNRADPRVLTECVVTGTVGSEATQTQPIVMDPPAPAATAIPVQEKLPAAVIRPSGVCAAAATPTPITAPPTTQPSPSGAGDGPVGQLPATGKLPGGPLGTLAAAAGVAVAVGVNRRRRSADPEP